MDEVDDVSDVNGAGDPGPVVDPAVKPIEEPRDPRDSKDSRHERLPSDEYTGDPRGGSRESSGRGGAPVSLLPPGNVWLTGLMGTGKSTVGWQLSQIAGLGFVDLDVWIERQSGKRAHEIFRDDGEEAFRDWEKKGVLYWSGAKRFVIALGGGALVDETSWGRIRSAGALVWIKTPLPELARRLLAEGQDLANRPLLEDLLRVEDKDKQRKLMTERLGALLGSRQDRYKQASVVVDNGYTSPDVTARCIKELLMENGYFGRGESRMMKFANRWKRWSF